MSTTSNGVLRAVIVDDERLARRGLSLRLADVADVQIVGECGDGLAAVDMVQQLQPDLLFLDVQMPGLDGFGALQRVPLELMPQVIFVTAFEHHALRAFEANAVDYLLKPIQTERLAQALTRVRERRRIGAHEAQCAHLLGLLSALSGRADLRLSDALNTDDPAALKRSERLAIRDGGQTHLLAHRSIRWIDAAGDYMCVHSDAGTHILRSTMRELERNLDPNAFPRIHRSVIVNASRVVAMRPHANGEAFLRLDCGQELKLSRNFRERFRALG
jgi:two-component system, LytTR family, response regulator